MPNSADRKADGQAGSQGSTTAGQQSAPPDPWAPLLLQVDELREYFSYYLGARTDLFRARVRRLVTLAILLFVATVATATFAATAAALVLVGLGTGLGELLGGRIWLGNLIIGASILIITALGGLGATRWLNNASRLKTIRSYAQKREHQRREFGRDVSSRAKPR
jgi:amino acid transporter